MFDLAAQTVAMLAVAAFVAGFVDSIAGGGGLITVPALLLAGLSPVESLGTNKLQGLFGSGSATVAYASKGQVNPRKQLASALMSCLGSACGALAATVVPGRILSAALPVVLVAIALYFAFKPNMNDVDRAERISPFLFGVTLVPLIGFYDGLFGPWKDVASGGLPLFPYAEFVKFGAPDGEEPADAALDLLRGHLTRRAKRNPLACYAGAFEDHARALAGRAAGDCGRIRRCWRSSDLSAGRRRLWHDLLAGPGRSTAGLRSGPMVAP